MRLIALLPLFIAGIGISTLSSCKKETVQNVVVPNQTIYKTINTNNWQFDNQTKTYYVDFSVPQITRDVNDIDAVIVYISGGSNIFEAIPSTYQNVSYTYTHQPGQLSIEISQPGGGTANPPTVPIQVKIVIVQSSN